MRAALPILLLLCATALPGCQMNERLSGTLMGGVGGGAIGAAVGGVGGAAIGVLAGGIGGYLVGDYVADQRERGRSQVFDSPTTSQAGSYVSQGSAVGQVAGVKVRVGSEAARSAYERGRQALTAPEARVYFEESIRFDPSRPEPYNALALNALYRGDRSEAERNFQQALAVDPSYAPARYNLDRLRRQSR